MDRVRQPEEAFKDGYWVVICDQLTNAASVDDLAYYSLLGHSRQLYLELKQNQAYRSKMLGRCKFTDEVRLEK